MKMRSKLSRRRFVSLTAMAAVAGSTAKHARAMGLMAGEEASGADWKSEGVLNLNHSAHAKLKNIPVGAVTIGNGFWSKRRATNVQSSIPSMHDELIAPGRMTNFSRLKGGPSEPQKGPV
ncbi:MAG: hypothetical protein NVSMB3_00080 [Acidobacteriaceae bacterium]